MCRRSPDRYMSVAVRLRCDFALNSDAWSDDEGLAYCRLFYCLTDVHAFALGSQLMGHGVA